ncbi:unnamed protein product [Amoebophrya sp. A120]|nr:unnamed protein product [Amoebophrya sp. A120]|eukprot:GSA120T00018827001.1
MQYTMPEFEFMLPLYLFIYMPYSYDLYGQYLYEKIMDRLLVLPPPSKLMPQQEVEDRVNVISRLVVTKDVGAVVTGKGCKLRKEQQRRGSVGTSTTSPEDEDHIKTERASFSFADFAKNRKNIKLDPEEALREFLEENKSSSEEDYSSSTRISSRPRGQEQQELFDCLSDETQVQYLYKPEEESPAAQVVELAIGGDLASAIHAQCLSRALVLLEAAGMAWFLFAYIAMKDKAFAHYQKWRDQVCIPALLRQSEMKKGIDLQKLQKYNPADVHHGEFVEDGELLRSDDSTTLKEHEQEVEQPDTLQNDRTTAPDQPTSQSKYKASIRPRKKRSVTSEKKINPAKPALVAETETSVDKNQSSKGDSSSTQQEEPAAAEKRKLVPRSKEKLRRVAAAGAAVNPEVFAVQEKILTSPTTLHLGSSASMLNLLQWLMLFFSQILGNSFFRRERLNALVMAGGSAAKTSRHDDDWSHTFELAAQAVGLFDSIMRKTVPAGNPNISRVAVRDIILDKKTVAAWRRRRRRQTKTSSINVEDEKHDNISAAQKGTHPDPPPSANRKSQREVSKNEDDDFALQSVLRNDEVMTTCPVVSDQLLGQAVSMVKSDENLAKANLDHNFESCVLWDQYRLCGGPLRLPVEGYPSELILLGLGVGKVVDLRRRRVVPTASADAGVVETTSPPSENKFVLEFALRSVNGAAQLSIETPSRCELLYGAGYHRAWLENTACSVIKHESFVNEVQMRRFFPRASLPGFVIQCVISTKTSEIARKLAKKDTQFLSIDSFSLTFEYSGVQGHHVKLFLHQLEKLNIVKQKLKETDPNYLSKVLDQNNFGMMSDRMTTLFAVPVCRIAEPPDEPGLLDEGDARKRKKVVIKTAADVFRPAFDVLWSRAMELEHQTTSASSRKGSMLTSPKSIIDKQHLEFGTCLPGLFGLRRAGIFQQQGVLLNQWTEVQKAQIAPRQISMYELGPPDTARPDLEKLREILGEDDAAASHELPHDVDNDSTSSDSKTKNLRPQMNHQQSKMTKVESFSLYRVAPELMTLYCEDRINSASMEWDLVAAQGLVNTACLYRNRHVDWLLYTDLDEAMVPGSRYTWDENDQSTKNKVVAETTAQTRPTTFHERFRTYFGTTPVGYAERKTAECKIPPGVFSGSTSNDAPAVNVASRAASSAAQPHQEIGFESAITLPRPVTSGVYIQEITYGGPDDLQPLFVEKVEQIPDAETKVLTDFDVVSEVWPTPWDRWSFRLPIPKTPVREFVFPRGPKVEDEKTSLEKFGSKTGSSFPHGHMLLNMMKREFGEPYSVQTVMQTTGGEKANILSETTHEDGVPRFVFEDPERMFHDGVSSTNITQGGVCHLSRDRVHQIGLEKLENGNKLAGEFLQSLTVIAPDEYRPIKEANAAGSRKSMKSTAVRPGEMLLVGQRCMRGRVGTQLHISRMADLSIHHYRYAMSRPASDFAKKINVIPSLEEKAKIDRANSVEEVYPSKVHDPAATLRLHTVFDPVFAQQLSREEEYGKKIQIAGKSKSDVLKEPEIISTRSTSTTTTSTTALHEESSSARAESESSANKPEDLHGSTSTSVPHFSCTEVVASDSYLQRTLDIFLRPDDENDESLDIVDTGRASRLEREKEEEEVFRGLGLWLKRVLNLDEGPISFKRFLSLVYDNFVELKTVPNLAFETQRYDKRKIPGIIDGRTPTLRDGLVRLVFSNKWRKLIKVVAEALAVPWQHHVALHDNAVLEDRHKLFAEYERGDVAFKDKDENFLIPILYLANLQDLNLKSVSGPRALKDYRKLVSIEQRKYWTRNFVRDCQNALQLNFLSKTSGRSTTAGAAQDLLKSTAIIASSDQDETTSKGAASGHFQDDEQRLTSFQVKHLRDDSHIYPSLRKLYLPAYATKEEGTSATSSYSYGLNYVHLRPHILGYKNDTTDAEKKHHEERMAELQQAGRNSQGDYAINLASADKLLEELSSIEEIYAEAEGDPQRMATGYTEEQQSLLQLLADRVFTQLQTSAPNYKSEFLATFPVSPPDMEFYRWPDWWQAMDFNITKEAYYTSASRSSAVELDVPAASTSQPVCHLRVALLARAEEVLAWYLEETMQRTEMFQSQVNRFSRLALNHMHVRPSSVDDPMLLLFYYLLSDALFPLLYAYNREHRLAFDQVHRHYLREFVLTKEMAKGFGVLFDEGGGGGKWFESENAQGAQAKLGRVYARVSNDPNRFIKVMKFFLFLKLVQIDNRCVMQRWMYKRVTSSFL